MSTTCQICGRAILANTGRIAHHGYKRPGHGWQTASCMGARGLPYEVSCDLLPRAIESIANYIATQNASLAALVANPPAVLKWQRRDAYGRPQGRLWEVPKPDGFSTARRPSYHAAPSYEGIFEGLRHELDSNIRHAGFDLEFMQKRLAAWKPPANCSPGELAAYR